MEWIERLNSAITYIEDHLDDEIDYDQLAKIALCSTFHFRRMFGYMTGVTLAEYIRRRRMSCAAADIQAGERILDIALKYGYESPTAFNRAFQAIHGIPPSQAKKQGVTLRTSSPISFDVSVKGGQEMDYRIEKKPSFRLLGIREAISNGAAEGSEAASKFWRNSEAAIPEIVALRDANAQGLLGVSTCNEVDNTYNYYYIAVSSSAEAPSEMYELIVAENTWAVFTGSGTQADFQLLQQQIISEWLPTSGYEWANAPDVEWYLSEDTKDTKDICYEFWLPVVAR